MTMMEAESRPQEAPNPDNQDSASGALLNELRALTEHSPPTLDTLASNINPTINDKPPATDSYWRNVADLHQAHPHAVDAARKIMVRNDQRQSQVDNYIAQGPGLNAETEQFEKKEAIHTIDEWYRSLGTHNSLHNQGERLEQAANMMLASTLAFRRVENFEDLVRQPSSPRAIADVLTSLDMKVDSSHDPVREKMAGQRLALIGDARVKAHRIGELIDQRLETEPDSPDRVGLVSQRFRTLRIKYGAAFDQIQVVAAHGSRTAEQAQQSATEPISPRFPDWVTSEINKKFPGVDSFEEQHDILVHQELAQLANETLGLMAADQAPNGDVGEIVAFLLAARQYCTLDNADAGEYLARFATWRQDAPMDGVHEGGKHSFDLELIHTTPTPGKPTWRLPIQVKAKGSGGAAESAGNYDTGIIVLNLFSDIEAEAGSENAQGSENYQIAQQLQRLVQSVFDAEQDALAAYAGKEWRGRTTEDDRHYLVTAEKKLRTAVNSKLLPS